MTGAAGRSRPHSGYPPLLTVLTSAILLIFSAAQGVIGSFEFSQWPAGPVPAAALICGVAIGVTCLLRAGPWTG